MKTIFCPACGQRCKILQSEGIDYSVQCPENHKWFLTIDFDSKTSEDGTAIIGFQCESTHASLLPDETSLG